VLDTPQPGKTSHVLPDRRPYQHPGNNPDVWSTCHYDAYRRGQNLGGRYRCDTSIDPTQTPESSLNTHIFGDDGLSTSSDWTHLGRADRRSDRISRSCTYIHCSWDNRRREGHVTVSKCPPLSDVYNATLQRVGRPDSGECVATNSRSGGQATISATRPVEPHTHRDETRDASS